MRKAADLFSGTGSATEPFRESDEWKVFDVELNPEDKFPSSRIDREEDVKNLTTDDFPDDIEFIWASPPCTTFSMASLGHYWEKRNGKYIPKKEKARKHLELVKHTVRLIKALNPDYWFIENPRAMLKVILEQEEDIQVPEPRTVTYCQYGDERMKPTHLWGEHPDQFPYWKCSNGDNCHKSAPRGSQTGTQGLSNAKERAMIPRGLSEAVFKAVTNRAVEAEHRKQKTISRF